MMRPPTRWAPTIQLIWSEISRNKWPKIPWVSGFCYSPEISGVISPYLSLDFGHHLVAIIVFFILQNYLTHWDMTSLLPFCPRFEIAPLLSHQPQPIRTEFTVWRFIRRITWEKQHVWLPVHHSVDQLRSHHWCFCLASKKLNFTLVFWICCFSVSVDVQGPWYIQHIQRTMASLK